jgi:hypothetical protein
MEYCSRTAMTSAIFTQKLKNACCHIMGMRNYKMCTFVIDKLLPTFHGIWNFFTIKHSTYVVNPTYIYQQYFINRLKILTPKHQYIVSNTDSYNMKCSCKQGDFRGNTLEKNFAVRILLVFGPEDGVLILKHAAQYYHIHTSLPLNPILS